MIINARITEAVKVLRCFSKLGQNYWIDKLDLCNSDKGFIKMYLGLCGTL